MLSTTLVKFHSSALATLMGPHGILERTVNNQHGSGIRLVPPVDLLHVCLFFICHVQYLPNVHFFIFIFNN